MKNNNNMTANSVHKTTVTFPKTVWNQLTKQYPNDSTSAVVARAVRYALDNSDKWKVGRGRPAKTIKAAPKPLKVGSKPTTVWAARPQKVVKATIKTQRR